MIRPAERLAGPTHPRLKTGSSRKRATCHRTRARAEGAFSEVAAGATDVAPLHPAAATPEAAQPPTPTLPANLEEALQTLIAVDFASSSMSQVAADIAGQVQTALLPPRV